MGVIEKKTETIQNKSGPSCVYVYVGATVASKSALWP